MKTNYSSLEALREIHLLSRANFDYTQHAKMTNEIVVQTKSYLLLASFSAYLQ